LVLHVAVTKSLKEEKAHALETMEVQEIVKSAGAVESLII
jgi:hypothetical protein